MPLKGVSNLPESQRSSAKSSTTTPHHESHGSYKPKSSKSKSFNPNAPVMPFMQQMQLLQALEGGRLEDHIRRHHKHLGEASLEEAKNQNFKGDGDKDLKESLGYVITDERGMIWFDEEEAWEFKELLPKEADDLTTRDGATQAVIPKPSGLRKLFGASKKPQYVITGWETFDHSGDYGVETDDDSGGISPGVTRTVGFASSLECNAVPAQAIHRCATSYRRPAPAVPENNALKLPPPPPPHHSSVSRKKHPVVTHTAAGSPPYVSPQAAIKTMSHNQLKEEFLAQAFAPSVSLPATRSHTPLSTHSQISFPPASRSQSSLALPSSSSTRSVSPFARLRGRKASTSGAKQ